MKTNIPMNGSMVKNHISLKTGFGYPAIRRTSSRLWYQACQVRPLDLHQLQRTPSRQESHSSSSSSASSSSPTVSEIQTRERGDQTESDTSPVQVSNSVDDRSGRPDDTQANKPSKTNIKETTIELGDPLYSEILEWLQEFRENSVDDEIPVHGGSHASSSHDASLEPIFKRREDLGKHSVETHFPKDRNCEICKRTKITRAPCRRRNGGAVPRAQNFGDLITADHKVLSDNCESRNNHRYAVVVQDLATQWIQAYPCKTKTSQETQRSLQKFLEPDRNPEVIYTDNSLEFGKACEDLSWNHCTSTPQRSETYDRHPRSEDQPTTNKKFNEKLRCVREWELSLSKHHLRDMAPLFQRRLDREVDTRSSRLVFQSSSLFLSVHVVVLGPVPSCVHLRAHHADLVPPSKKEPLLPPVAEIHTF